MASITFLDSGDMDRAALSRSIVRFIEARVSEGRRIALRVADQEASGKWDRFLWSWSDQSFLPHSILDREWPPDEPVTVTTSLPPQVENLLLFCLDDIPLDDLAGFDDVYEIVDRNNEEGLERARARWAEWKGTGRAREYRRDWAAGGQR